METDGLAGGTGKTFLTSKVVDYKIALLDSSPNDEAVAFFYFSRSDSTRNSALACLRSLVRQLSTCRSRQGHIRSSFRRLYQNCRRDGRNMNWDICKKQVTESLDLFPRSTIIVDALDECDEDDRQDLVQLLSEMMRSSRRPLNIFISGRPDGDIRDAFRDRVQVEIGVKDNQGDIAKFVEQKVKEHRRWEKFTRDTKERVVTTLIEQSQAMFRWAALQIHELLKLQLEEEVNARLGKLPKDLKTTYDEIYLRQIKDRGEIESAIAERAIMWLIVAFEPLDSKLLLSAVRINAGRYNDMLLEPGTDVPGQRGIPRASHVDYITEEIDKKLLLELCANLLTYDLATGKWNFAHASVLEYFEAHHFSELHAHAYVVFTTLMVIIDIAQPVAARGPLGPLLKKSLVAEDGRKRPECGQFSSNHSSYSSLFRCSLVSYAFAHWGDHASLVDKGVNSLKAVHGSSFERDAHTITQGLRILLQRFLGHPNNSSSEYRFWRNAFFHCAEHHRDDLGLSEIYYGQTTETYASFTAVHYGLFNMLSNWWQGSCNGHDSGNCPTCEACSWPNVDTTATSEKNRWSLLSIAAYFGHAQIIDALLSMGMDVNSGEYTNVWLGSTKPLCLASRQGFIEVCRTLITYCQPERPSGLDDALYVAAQKYHHHIVRYLLSAGANPSYYIPVKQDTVLALAARKNNTEVLRMIFEDNLDQQRVHFPSQRELVDAAFDAAFDLSIDALQCLVLEGHIDPNARYSGQRFGTETILLAAAHNISSWNSRVLRCLRECGVDFNIRGADLCRLRKSQQLYKYTLLEAAVCTGDVEFVRVAVEQWGEDVNAISDNSRESHYGCALIAAVSQGHLQMVQYLLKNNADATCQVPLVIAQSGHTPLSVALRRGHFKIADTLIEHGADINIPIKYGFDGSHLVAAASQSTVDALKFAINAGAVIDAPLEYGYYGSALICATALNRVPNVQYLLDHGADINYRATIGEFASALMAASYFRNGKMVSFLIERGADVNRPENHGWKKMLEERAEQ